MPVDSRGRVPYVTLLAERPRRPGGTDRSRRVTLIDPLLLELLACPVPQCRGRLELCGERLRCVSCELQYDMSDGWPNLIPEDAVARDKSDDECSP